MKRKILKHKPGAERSVLKPDVIARFTVEADLADKLRAVDAARIEAAGEKAEGDNEPQARLLPALYALMADRKRVTVKDFLKHGQVKVNGTVTTLNSQAVNVGDLVEVNTSRQWQVFSIPRLKIVYEDDYIIVANKGYGLLSMSTDRVKDGTAYSLLRDYVKRVDPRNKLFIVHRLDQHTSGLMMFAKTEEAKEKMQHNWNNMVIDRRYAAIVEGRPEQSEGTSESYLAENAEHLMYSTEDKAQGKLAVTRWKAVKSRNGYTLMDVSLDTGRKNQIRVHMSEMGHPIAGDRRYGAKSSPMHRLALHARTLRFVHPVTGADMNFSLPLPAAFTKLV